MIVGIVLAAAPILALLSYVIGYSAQVARTKALLSFHSDKHRDNSNG